jgi:LysR family glycine cleavage system transcriptional activator
MPSLNALRAFEAAARHSSFTKAALELNVTQAAISHQVKALEESLDAALFRRNNRVLELTEAARILLPDVTAAFDMLAAATDRFTARQRPLVLTVLPSFAAKWLLPRLRRLRERHPSLDVKLDTSDDTMDFALDEVDVAVRYGQGNWPALASEKLLDEEIFPVCAPELLSGPAPLRNPSDLRQHVLLHDRMNETWAMWLKAAGARGVNPDRGPAFTHSAMVLAAAIDGLGVALARSPLVADDIAAGRLVRPFRASLPAQASYYFVCRPADADEPRIVALRQWLRDEVAAMAPTAPASLSEDG